MFKINSVFEDLYFIEPSTLLLYHSFYYIPDIQKVLVRVITPKKKVTSLRIHNFVTLAGEVPGNCTLKSERHSGKYFIVKAKNFATVAEIQIK